MTPKEYQTLALTTDFDPKNSPLVSRISDPHLARCLHGSIGLCTEVGEVQDVLKKSIMRGIPVNDQDIKEELGDMIWYMTILLDEIGSSFEEIMQGNIDKLRKRYPEGFNEVACAIKADKEKGPVS